MSDYCKDCSEKWFGKDFKELANICEENQEAYVLCEGCGFIVVDNTGKKIRDQEGSPEKQMRRFLGHADI